MSYSMTTLKRQQGVTLLVAMITMIVLMLLGIGAMTASNTMFKLAGNLQFQNEAKNRAENALVAAENALMVPGAAAAIVGTSNVSITPDNWPNGLIPVQGVIVQRITQTPVNATDSEPCLVDCINVTTASFHLYRLTAQGTSSRGATRYVESIVQIPAS